MDTAFATLNVSANVISKGVGRNRSSVFWGEGTRGSFNSRFCSIQPCKSSKTRNFKPGFVYAVYTPDVNQESVVTPDVKKESVVNN